MNVVDLFSGIGGFSLGFERAGMRTIAFCEIEPFCRKILRKHWPDVPIFEDVRELHAEDLPEPVDLVCGGYPCQPFSVAGKRRGAEDDRHLWPEIVRLIRELDVAENKPAWCLFENVAGHISMGLDTVLSDLEAEGYTAWPLVIPACAINALHRRDRVLVLAYDSSAGRKERDTTAKPSDKGHATGGGDQEFVSDTKRKHDDDTRHGASKIRWERSTQAEIQGCSFTNPQGQHADEHHAESEERQAPESGEGPGGKTLANSRTINQRGEWNKHGGSCCTGRRGHGNAEREFRRTDDGLSRRLHGNLIQEPTAHPVTNRKVKNRTARLRALGNAVVPQIPEIIGRAIMAVEGEL